MLLIPCPWCGPRDEAEFRYGGQAGIAHPEDPWALADTDWARYLFVRDNPEGPFAERWFHTFGCRRWCDVRRNTVDNRITASAPPGGLTAEEGNGASAEAGPFADPAPPQDAATASRTGPPQADGRNGRADAGAGGIERGVVPPEPDPARPDDNGALGTGPDESAEEAGRRHGAARGRRVTILFDGRELPAYEGEPLSAALLANGVHTIAAGTYTGRPRGVFSDGAEEPCAYVRVDSPPGEAMVQATRVEVHDGLRAAGLAGFAALPEAREAPTGDTMWAHCDVLVAGAGPAGLAAAQAAAEAGARVILADDRPGPGGRLPGARRRIDGRPAGQWASDTAAALAGTPDVRVLMRTTVTGHYDHGELIALERRPAAGRRGAAAHRLWHIRARGVIVATGAVERPIAFEGNDRPGVMSAGAAVRYTWRHGVLPGRRAAVFGCGDEALWSAVDLHDAGVTIAAAVDARPTAGTAPAAALRERGIDVLCGYGIVRTAAGADGRLSGVAAAPIDKWGRTTGPERVFECDLLAVSGGHDPAMDLALHAGARQRWSPEHAAFLPAALPEGTRCVGAAAGTRDPQAARTEGLRAGRAAAAEALGTGDGARHEARGAAERTAADRDGAPAGGGLHDPAPPMVLWTVTGPATDTAAAFVDPQRDATLADIRAALDTGMASIEHIKRYTTIGTGPDQGRTCATLATGITAGLLGRGMDEVGTTTARPPCTPIPFSALAGRERGSLFDPVRRTPMHEWHTANGAVFEDVGQWKRPRYYPGDGEDMRAAVLRECRAARESAGVLDASTLGKLIVAGRDAGAFLDRVYTGTFSTLRPGRCRYGVMCTAEGMVLDDGVGVRLSDDRYLVTTTTGNAETVRAWLEEWAQTEWPDLCVHITDVTDHWATVSVVGPRSRAIMERIAPGLDVSAEGFTFMSAREATVAGAPARVLRVSFTGELTFEINVPAWYGPDVWTAVLEAGRPFGITPYGTEAMHVLRAEKGFIVVGHETDGSVTPADVGLEWAFSARTDFVGKRSLRRADTARQDREQLVGLLPEDTGHVLAEGAQIVADPPAVHRPDGDGPSAVRSRAPVPMLGRVTSSYESAALGRSFALALLRGGRGRHGERLYVVHLDQAVPVLVTDPVFYDKEGARRDG